MKKYIYISLVSIVLLLGIGCGDNTTNKAEIAIENASWNEIVAHGKGETVTMMMWMGDPKINGYMQNYIAPLVLREHQIKLEFVSGQGGTIVQLLANEKQANREESDVDLVWINGETFYQLRQLQALYGPWTAKVPNAAFIDFENPFIGTDFQQPISGFEMPWGNVQMTIIYNSQKIVSPPMNREELRRFVQTNPGKFTFDNHFTGLTFLKALFIDIAGGQEAVSGDFDEEVYIKYSSLLWEYIKEIQPYLWREGTVFPENVAQMHQLFGSGELWFTMSNNDAEVDSKVEAGIFPTTSRAYVPDFGSIQNSHYIGITSNSSHKAAAMLVANTLISPEAQVLKMNPKVWGDGTVLHTPSLNSAMQTNFEHIPSRKYAPLRKNIAPKALQELAPEYMIRLAADFNTKIIHNN